MKPVATIRGVELPRSTAPFFHLLARGAAVLTAAVFLGFLISVAIKFVFGVSGNLSSWLVGVPVFLILFIVFWRKLPLQF
jgi:hypothetical protein